MKKITLSIRDFNHLNQIRWLIFDQYQDCEWYTETVLSNSYDRDRVLMHIQFAKSQDAIIFLLKQLD